MGIIIARLSRFGVVGCERVCLCFLELSISEVGENSSFDGE